MNLSAHILKWFGWTVHITVPDYDRCLICVAPHTSNWDFIVGKLAYASVHRHAGFLMKETWFFPPLSWIFKAMGGVPVPLKKGSDLTHTLIERFKKAKRLQLAITPEGTRSLTTQWRTGFLRIAYGANIPIVLATIDFATKTVLADTTFISTGDIQADMASIKNYYLSTGAQGKYPEKFSAQPGDEQPPTSK